MAGEMEERWSGGPPYVALAWYGRAVVVPAPLGMWRWEVRADYDDAVMVAGVEASLEDARRAAWAAMSDHGGGGERWRMSWRISRR